MTLNGGLACGEMLCTSWKMGALKIMEETNNFQGIFCTFAIY